MTMIRKLKSAWTVAFVGSHLLPMVCIAAASEEIKKNGKGEGG